MKLGIVQMKVTNKVDENLETARRNVSMLANNGAELIVLPEMFCCPYRNDSFVCNAEEVHGHIWQCMAESAKQNSVYLVAGSMPERDGEKLYNTSFVFSPKGEQIARHRKMHLFDIDVKGGQRFCESDTFSAGRDITVFDTPYGKVGLCICFDMRFPELARILALRGAQMILVPAAFNMTTGPAHWELMLRSRAVDNQVFVAGIAPARDDNASYVSYGHSMVVSPWGEQIVSADEAADSFVIELDFKEVDRIRCELPLLSARRTDIYELKTL